MTKPQKAQEKLTDPFAESMSIATAAATLGCSQATVRTMIFRGGLKAYRVGTSGRMIRILNSDFNALWKPVDIYGPEFDEDLR
jgi:excisionase family DNA binding protein